MIPKKMKTHTRRTRNDGARTVTIFYSDCEQKLFKIDKIQNFKLFKHLDFLFSTTIIEVYDYFTS